MKPVVFVLVLAATVFVCGISASARTPNIIIFLADDLGIGDVGCYGCTDIRTPQIDALAQTGVRFTDFYVAAPICSPSRAALLTGRYPARAGMSTERNVGSGEGDAGLPPSEVTLAELAKTRGYATGIVGKWHLGFTPDSVPNAQGFDFFFGFHASALDYFSHLYYLSDPYRHDLFRNRQEVFESGTHLNELFAREAARFVEENARRPFLLYVAFNAPHYPMTPQPRFLEQYKEMPVRRRDYAALVAGMDEAIGRVMAAVRRHELAKDTLVFFTSDNGAAIESQRGEGGGTNRPFRGHKKTLWEGGIRMPAVVSWPGTLPQGETRKQVTIAMDVFPTVAELIGAELPKDRTIDGRSWLPLLKDAKAPGHETETVFFEWAGQQAARQGRWKLVRNGTILNAGGKPAKAQGDDAVFLADLEVDPGEQKNLRKEHPEIAEKLLKLIDAWRADLPKTENP